MPMSTPERLSRLHTLMMNATLDAAAFVPGPNMVYLTGIDMHLSQDRPLILVIPAEGEAVVIVPTLEAPRFTSLPFPAIVYPYTDDEGFIPAFEAAAAKLGMGDGARIGVEGLRMRVLEGRLLEKYIGGSTVYSADEALMPLRLHKTPDEIAAMRKAIALSQKALTEIVEQVRVGMTERHIAAMLTAALNEAGSAGDSFPAIVLSGPNSALPHGAPGSRKVAEGDLVLFDYGGTADGYPADITRTFAIGVPDDRLAAIYATVLAANEAAIRACKPGVAALEVDRAARQVITDAGYGEYFTHRTGHGLGVDIHEPPYINGSNTQLLETGMVFTIEPGIYVPGIGGVRIEDNVLITDSGVDVLTTFPKDLQVIGWP